MTFPELARKRYSTRKYSTQPVEKEKIDLILEAGRIAPSAANRQPWYFIVVQNQAQRELMWEVYRRPWFQDAPVHIILCADHTISWKRSDGKDHADVDLAIATDHMTLAAAELGIGSCWICNFDAPRCSQVLGLPAHIEPVVILSVGYPLDESDPNRHDTQRKPTNEIVRYESF